MLPSEHQEKRQWKNAGDRMLFDDQGKLFGKINLIDLCVVILLGAFVPVGIIAYRILNLEVPLVETIEPVRTRSKAPVKLMVRGLRFHPRAKIRVGPLTLTPLDGGNDELVSAIIPVTKLPPGSHDVFVINPNGLTGKAPRPFVRLKEPEFHVEAYVKFRKIAKEILSKIKVGQVARDEFGTVIARILALGKFREAQESLSLGGRTNLIRRIPNKYDVIMKLLFYVTTNENHIQYNGKMLNEKSSVSFVTPEYSLQGSILGFPGAGIPWLPVKVKFTSLMLSLASILRVGDTEHAAGNQLLARVERILSRTQSKIILPGKEGGLNLIVGEDSERRDVSVILLVDASVRPGLQRTYEYKGQEILIGSTLQFKTARYKINGTIEDYDESVEKLTAR